MKHIAVGLILAALLILFKLIGSASAQGHTARPCRCDGAPSIESAGICSPCVGQYGLDIIPVSGTKGVCGPEPQCASYGYCAQTLLIKATCASGGAQFFLIDSVSGLEEIDLVASCGNSSYVVAECPGGETMNVHLQCFECEAQ